MANAQWNIWQWKNTSEMHSIVKQAADHHYIDQDKDQEASFTLLKSIR